MSLITTSHSLEFGALDVTYEAWFGPPDELLLTVGLSELTETLSEITKLLEVCIVCEVSVELALVEFL